MNRGKRLGDNLVVASMASKDKIVGIQIISLSDSCRFLADGEMCRAGIGIVHTRIHALLLNIKQHQLKSADREHILVDTKEILFAEVLLFLFDRLVILVDINILKMDLSRSPKLVRVSIQTFWHFLVTFL